MILYNKAMEVVSIKGNNYTECFNKIITLMRSRKAELGRKHILFVPDKYTLFAERKLYEGTRGAFDAEVLTFNRLLSRISEGGGYITKQGAVLLLQKILREIQGELKVFSRSIKFSGFATRIYETISQLASCRIKPSDLLGRKGASQLKLNDLALIYQKYLEKIENKLVDASARYEQLILALDETDYFNGATVYFANFDIITEQTKVIIDKICSASEIAYIAEPSIKWGEISQSEIYTFQGGTQAIKATAKRIREMLIPSAYGGEGYSADDVCVISYDLDRVARIFDEFDIPYHVDKKYVLSVHPLCRFIKKCVEIEKRLPREEVIKLAKNPYADIPAPYADAFEDYCNSRQIDYQGFYNEFDDETAEIARKKLMSKISSVCENLLSCATASKFTSALTDVFSALKAGEITSRLNEVAGDVNWGDVPQRILSVTESIALVYANETVSFSTLFNAFEEIIEATELSLLPQRVGCVNVGGIEMMRGKNYKCGFVLDCSEGAFPIWVEDSGIISDLEANTVLSGLNVHPLVSELNADGEREAISFLSSCERVFVAVPSFKREAFIIKDLRNHSKKVIEVTSEAEKQRVYERLDNRYIASYVSSIKHATELLYEGIGGIKRGLKGYGIEAELAKITNIEPWKEKKEVAIKTELSSEISISRIQEYYSCPYKHFLKYGLKLRERDDGALKPVDVGNLMHEIIEKFVNLKKLDDVEKNVKDIINQILVEKPFYVERTDEFALSELINEAVFMATVVAEQLKKSAFVPFAQEMRFGRGDEVVINGKKEKQLAVNAIEVDGKKYYFNGIIDRVDVFENYARVIDYKTGKVGFSFDELYYGKKIQLLIYMKILEWAGYSPAGMFYFPFSTSWQDTIDNHRLIGVFSSNPDIVSAHDVSLSECGVKSSVIKAKTKTALDKVTLKPSLEKRALAYDESELSAFGGYAVELSKNAIREITNGNVKKSPLSLKGCTCDYCEMSVACGYDADVFGVRNTKKVTADTVLTRGND